MRENTTTKLIGNRTGLYWLAPETGLVGVFGNFTHVVDGDDRWDAGIIGKSFANMGGMDIITELSGSILDLSDSDTKAWGIGGAISLFPSANFMVQARAGFRQIAEENKDALSFDTRDMKGYNIGLNLAWKPNAYPMVLSVFGDYSAVDAAGRYYDNADTLIVSSEDDVSNVTVGAKISFSFGGVESETKSLAAMERSGVAFIGMR